MADAMTVTEIGGGIWQFNEASELVGGPYVDAYLIVGSERALLVDSLQNETAIFDGVRQITSLPLDVVITHGHGDHAGKSLRLFHEAGCKIYMDMRDIDILKGGFGDGYEDDWFTDVADGDRFDIGGFRFEIISIPGHSPGSLVLLEREKQLLFSGDTIGSGHFWMQVPTAVALNVFGMGLDSFWEQVKDLSDLLVYPGHRNQSPVQLNLQYVKDTRTITKRLLSGVWVGEDGEMKHRVGLMKFKRIGYGLMRDYLYDPQNMRFHRPDPKLEAIKDSFTEGEITADNLRMGYQFFTPEVKEGETYPLVVYLHGAGERGSETRIVLANSGGTTFATPEWQAKHPCYIFAPQCADEAWWTMDNYVTLITKALETLPMEHAIDRNRIYITGLSMGGMGTWNLISKHPGLFAAAMPICGGGDPMEVRSAKEVPVWAFHAEDDPVVPVTGILPLNRGTSSYGTRDIVASLREAGNREVHYTEYETGYMQRVYNSHAHASWVPAYDDAAAKEWLFAQTLATRYHIDFIQPGVWHIEDSGHDSFYVVEGADKALVIDTGMGGDNIMEVIRSLTRLPLELAVTHCHGDHMYHSDKFGKFYMSAKEMSILPGFMESMMPHSKTTADDIIHIKEGDSIDLGGGVVIEVLEINGHTPGSVAFLDAAHGICFTGDAVGSGCGVWMQVPGAMDLSAFKANLEGFLAQLN
ncbi:MBL fold metallo-hydrolase, partial [Ruminococcaceae bacterium OttesenSCG-928-L11]|nr:MBL fold metallo-hydrolase [Ruminococcaceae bacterium OttesenSCG-928-L11]